VAPKRRVSSDTLMTDSLTLEPPPTRKVVIARTLSMQAER